MALTEIQQALACLYTDRILRRRFTVEPEKAGLAMGWDCSTIAYLMQVCPAEMAGFARSLQTKRLGAVKDLLPCSAKAIGAGFDELFLRFADSYVPSGVRKHVEDARTFAGWALSESQRHGLEPWQADLLRYERCWLATYSADCFLRMARFAYPVHIYPKGAGASAVGMDLIRRPVLVVWLRLKSASACRCIVLRWI
jgi:hypothetical protein